MHSKILLIHIYNIFLSVPFFAAGDPDTITAVSLRHKTDCVECPHHGPTFVQWGLRFHDTARGVSITPALAVLEARLNAILQRSS